MLCHEAVFASVSTGTDEINSLSARTLCSDCDPNMDHRSGLIDLIHNDSLAAITLLSDWVVTMDHRSRLANPLAGTQLLIRIKICSSGPCKIVMGKIVIIAHPSHQGPRP